VQKPQRFAAGFDPLDFGLFDVESDDERPDAGALGVFAVGVGDVPPAGFEELELAASALGELEGSDGVEPESLEPESLEPESLEPESLEPESLDEDPPSADDFAPTAAACLLSVR
jgi:hypothetical protein